MFVWSNGQLTAPPYKARFQFSPGMMMSSNGNIFRATDPLCGEFTGPGPGEFPTQRPVTQSFGVFFELRLNKRLSKQSWGWWSETPSRSLWRHCNGKYVRCSRFDVVFCCSGSYRIISLERLAQYQRNKPKKKSILNPPNKWDKPKNMGDGIKWRESNTYTCHTVNP